MSEQGTQEWLNDRCGCASASRFIDIIAVSKSSGKPLKAREDYMWSVAGEQFYGVPTEPASAKSMDWGHALEPYAKEAYEIETGLIVVSSGFVRHPAIDWCGGSPDGLVNDDGGIEIKCPKDRRVHMQTWRNGMHVDHLPQVQGNIWINEREWFDFISYDPRAPEDFRLYVQRIWRNDKYIKALESHIVEFLADVKTIVEGMYANKRRDLCGTDSPGCDAIGGTVHEV